MRNMPVPEGMTREIFIAGGSGSLELFLVSTRFIGSLLLLLRLFGPVGQHTVHSSVGDGLTEVLAEVSGDDDEGTAQGGLPAEHFLWLVGIGVVEGDNGTAEMREGILQGLKHLRFVAGERSDALEIEARWWGPGECPVSAGIRPAYL